MTRTLSVRLQDLSGWLRKLAADEQHWQRLSYVLFVLVGLLLLVTFRQYGVTMDEEVQATYGDKVIAWYSSFFQDRRALDFTFIYGGFFEAIAQLGVRILPFEAYESRHLINSLFGLGAIVIAYRLGSEILNPMAGFFSSLFLTLTPVLYGHSFNNSKDIPFSTLCFASLYLIVLSYKHLQRLPKSIIVAIGVCIGLAMGVRVGGIILFAYLLSLWLAWLVTQLWLKPIPRSINGRKTLAALAGSVLCVLAISWLVMLICWPWAQVKPLVNPFRTLSEFAHFDTGIKSLFDGRVISDLELPWNYVLTWFSISLPEFYFISLLAGCALSSAFFLRFKKGEVETELLIKLTVLALATGLPIATVIVLHSRLYDAQRHLLFAMPPIAVLAGISLASLLKSSTHWLVKMAVSAMIAVSVGLTVLDMIQLHPYEYVYFNRINAGGLKGAAGKYETDYWGASYKEGAEWVINNYHPNTQETIPVANCSNVFFTAHYFGSSQELRQRFQPVDDNRDARIFLTTTRNGCPQKKIARGIVLHTVERQGVPLLYVIERTPR